MLKFEFVKIFNFSKGQKFYFLQKSFKGEIMSQDKAFKLRFENYFKKVVKKEKKKNLKKKRKKNFLSKNEKKKSLKK